MIDLQKKLTKLMHDKGMSAVDIEKSTGINRNTIYSILAGNSKQPSANNLYLIAKALSISLESFFTNQEDLSFENLTPEQIKIFNEAVNCITDIVIEKNITLSMDKLYSLIKELYQYSINTNPPNIDNKFAHWLLNKYAKL